MSQPTLELLQVGSLDIATGQVLDMGDEGVGILCGVVWKVGNEGLKVGVGPRIAGESCETVKCIRILRAR